MADDQTKPEPEAADAAANEAPPDEATVTDASTRVGDASAADDAPPARSDGAPEERGARLPGWAREEAAAAGAADAPGEKTPTLPDPSAPVDEAPAGSGEPPAAAEPPVAVEPPAAVEPPTAVEPPAAPA